MLAARRGTEGANAAVILVLAFLLVFPPLRAGTRESKETFRTLERRNPATAHLLIGYFGPHGGPHFFEKRTLGQQKLLLSANESLTRFIITFGERGFSAYAHYGPEIVALHYELGNGTLEWPQRDDPILLALAARFGVEPAVQLRQTLSPKALHAIAAFPLELAVKYRHDPRLLPLVKHSLERDCSEALAGALSRGNETTLSMLAKIIGRPEFRTRCHDLAGAAPTSNPSLEASKFFIKE